LKNKAQEDRADKFLKDAYLPALPPHPPPRGRD